MFPDGFDLNMDTLFSDIGMDEALLSEPASPIQSLDSGSSWDMDHASMFTTTGHDLVREMKESPDSAWSSVMLSPSTPPPTPALTPTPDRSDDLDQLLQEIGAMNDEDIPAKRQRVESLSMAMDFFNIDVNADSVAESMGTTMIDLMNLPMESPEGTDVDDSDAIIDVEDDGGSSTISNKSDSINDTWADLEGSSSSLGENQPPVSKQSKKKRKKKKASVSASAQNKKSNKAWKSILRVNNQPSTPPPQQQQQLLQQQLQQQQLQQQLQRVQMQQHLDKQSHENRRIILDHSYSMPHGLLTPTEGSDNEDAIQMVSIQSVLPIHTVPARVNQSASAMMMNDRKRKLPNNLGGYDANAQNKQSGVAAGQSVLNVNRRTSKGKVGPPEMMNNSVTRNQSRRKSALKNTHCPDPQSPNKTVPAVSSSTQPRPTVNASTVSIVKQPTLGKGKKVAARPAKGAVPTRDAYHEASAKLALRTKIEQELYLIEQETLEALQNCEDGDNKNMHNMLERRRRVALRRYMNMLQSLIPEIAYEEKTSKQQVLNAAARHAREVQAISARIESEKVQEKTELEKLEEELRQLQAVANQRQQVVPSRSSSPYLMQQQKQQSQQQQQRFSSRSYSNGISVLHSGHF